jgi:hypothetical protein
MKKSLGFVLCSVLYIESMCLKVVHKCAYSIFYLGDVVKNAHFLTFDLFNQYSTVNKPLLYCRWLRVQLAHLQPL